MAAAAMPPPAASTHDGNQQPKHTSSESTRPLFSELSVFHALPGVSPAPVVAVAPAKT